MFPEEESLPKMDEEVKESIFKELDSLGITIVNNSKIAEAFRTSQKEELGVKLKIADGNEYDTAVFLHAADRHGNTADLGCYEAGIERDDFGNVKIDEKMRSNIDHIYAAGDVVTSPLTDGECKHHGQAATSSVFGLEDTEQLSDRYPMGYYLLPEVASYGYTEEEAQLMNIQYIVGRADMANTSYGRNANEKDGFLKLLVNVDTEEIIGVHAVGRNTQEIVHFGILLVESHVPVGKVTGTVLNGSTVHELYHYAAVDAWSAIRSA